MSVPALQTPQTVEEVAEELLTEIANEANITDWKGLRWYHVGGNTPRSIVVLTRGKNPRTVKTISQTNNPQAWQSWQPVLADLLARRANGSKRVNHAELESGRM